MPAEHRSLHPLTETVGVLRVRTRRIGPRGRPGRAGGDLYGAVDTPFGARLVMGDVMGHGPGTAGRAATVLRAWRDLAAHEETLEGVAVRLHSLIASSAEPDRFVTATLVGIRPDGTGDLVCCGHPPPLLMRGRSAVCAAVPAPAPPLGLLDLDDGWCAAGCIPAGAWDRLLLYTDGVSDATDAAGTAYPLAECAAPLVDRPLDAFVEEVATDLLRHAGGRLRDDASLLAAELDGRPRGR